MVSQIGIVVTEAASYDRWTIIEKHVIQACYASDRERFGVKNDFASCNAGLPAAGARISWEIDPRVKGRKNVRIERQVRA